MAAWTAAARQAINIGRLSSPRTASLVHRRGMAGSADHHGPPKVNVWQDPLSPSKWKEEHFVIVSLAGWGLLVYGGYKLFTGGKDKKEVEVRSATLDTWLPEQVAFIHSMGNDKANSYWEAELPPNYDRVGIENFIRAKYEEKRWVPRDGGSKAPSELQGEKSPSHWQRPVERSGNGYATAPENTPEERKKIQPSNAVPVTRRRVPAPLKAAEQVTPVTKPQHVEKVEHVAPPQPPAETSKQATETAQITPPKVDYATDLFNMLSMDGPNENGSQAVGATADDNNWAGFQSAAEVSTAEKTGPPKAVENTPQSASGIEDLFNDSPSLIPSLAPAKPQKDVKNDIMSLFEKSNMVSPFAMHQQQLAMLAQQQSLLMAAAAKSSGVDLKYPAGVQQPTPNVSVQNWPANGFPISGVMPMGNQEELQKLMQTRNMTPAHPVGSSVQYPPSGFYAMGQVGPVNGMMPMGASKPPSTTPVSSTPSKSAKEYDFSSLTQGMFAKQ